MNPRGRRQRLNSIQQIADQLRQSNDIGTPDLTGSILDAVDAERPFLSLKTRRMVYAGRFAIGFAVVGLVGAVALAHRISPGMFDLSGRPAPLSAVVENVKCEAQLQLADLQKQVQTVAETGGTEAGNGSSQVLMTLVAPTSRSRTISVSCTMVGPTMPPGVAARQCDNTGGPAAACCAYKPLAGIRRLSGGLIPTQSDWRGTPALGSGARTPEVDSPFLLDQDTESPLAPK